MDNTENTKAHTSHHDDDLDKFLSSVELKEMEKESKSIVYGTDGKRSFFGRLNDYFVDRAAVPLKEKAYFFHLLAVMLDAGLPILKALKILARRTTHLRFKRTIQTLVYNIENGKKLSDSMEKFPDIFTDTEIGAIRSGEAVGHLDQMLFKLSGQLEKEVQLQQKLYSIFMYPTVVFITLVVAVIIVMLWVIPSLRGLFELSGRDLPSITQLFISTSDFLFDFWWLIIVGITAVYMLFSAYVRTEGGRFRWDYFKLTMPVLGELIRKATVARFVLLLSILVESGVPIRKTLKICAEALGNDVYRRKILAIRDNVEKGERISDNMHDATVLFPETVVNMINIGEGSASLGQVSDKLARHYITEVDNGIKRLSTLFEPIMLLLVALVVALTAVAVLSPLFSIGELFVG